MSAAAGAGAAANVVGGELQGWAALLDKWQMQDTFRNEMARQAQARGQAGGVFQTGLQQQGAAPYAQQMAQGAQNRMGMYGQLQSQPLGLNLSTQQSTSLARDDKTAQLRGQGRAALGSYSDASLAQALQRMETERQLNQISNFAGGEARNVYPLRMYEAQHAYDDLAAIGAAISSIGGSAANYAQIYGGNPGVQQQQQQPMWGQFTPLDSRGNPMYDPYAQYPVG